MMLDIKGDSKSDFTKENSNQFPVSKASTFKSYGARKKEKIGETSQGTPNNPVMDRVQTALYAQLFNTRDRIKRQLVEQEENFRSAKRDREDCGVELYGMQQQLSQLQNTFDDGKNRHEDLLEKRNADEKASACIKKTLFVHEQDQQLFQKQALKREIELEDVGMSLKSALQYNQETKDEVAVTKRAASKAREAVRGKEKNKEMQDNYIDGLSQQINDLQLDTTSVAKQLNSQKEHTSEANSVIKEISIDLEGLSFEKKQLVRQWNSSVLALGRRDQALAAASKALGKVKDSIKDHGLEYINLKRNLYAFETEKERKTFDNEKIVNELVLIDQVMANIQSEQEGIAEKYELLAKTISNTQEQEINIEREASNHSSQISALSHKIEAISRDRRELEERIWLHKEEQTSISQAATNIAKTEKLLVKRIHIKEIEEADVENELARLRIDTLNTKSHCSRLEEKIEVENLSLEEKDKKIALGETIVKKIHVEIESKMNKVDRLNRTYEQLLNGVEEEEPLGPFEAKIKRLQKCIGEMNTRAVMFQGEWLRNQTLLIQVIDKVEGLQMSQREKNATTTILKHKRLRLLQSSHSNTSILKVIESRIKGMHVDISRLNELIGNYSQTYDDMSNNKAIHEMEFKDEIKELDSTSCGIKIKISTAVLAKEDAMNQILDVEKEILIWEQKIKLERETQAALNSSEHSVEINGMEKEIHRMKLRLETMKRTQEIMIRDMEMTIHKREDIAVKYQNSTPGTLDGIVPITIAEVKKRMVVLKRQQKVNTNEITMTQSKCLNVKKRLEGYQNNTSRIGYEVESEVTSVGKIQIEINDKLFEKQRAMTKAARLHDLLKKYASLGSSNILSQEEEQFNAEKSIASIEKRMKTLLDAVSGLRIQHQQLDEVFRRVYVLANDIDVK